MTKLPPNVKTVARIAAGFGVAQSFLWVLLGALSLASYINCGFNDSESDSTPPITSYFTTVIHQYFFLNEYCTDYKTAEGVVSAFEIHVWSAAAVGTSGLWLILSICMFIFVTNENMSNVNSVIYSWSMITVVVCSTDLALGIVLGISYEAVGDLMNNYDTTSGQSELLELTALRAGSLLLMAMALRGFVLVLFNMALVVLLLYYAYLVNAALNRNEHNIHSMGPLYAFQGPKNRPEPWSTIGFEYDNNQGGQLNRAYSRSENDRERDGWHLPQARRVPESRDDSLYGRSLTRSDSWYRGKTTTGSQTPRPFSYLEEPQLKPPSPRTPPPASNAVPPWKRRDPLDSPNIHVPSPDYSPPQRRQPRLKSALKSTVY